MQLAWKDFSVSLPESDIPRLHEVLDSVTQEQVAEYQVGQKWNQRMKVGLRVNWDHRMKVGSCKQVGSRIKRDQGMTWGDWCEVQSREHASINGLKRIKG